MKYSFGFQGHLNILSSHKTTLEFTKDSHLTSKGNCIVGIQAEFSIAGLKQFLRLKKVKITMKVGKLSDTVIASPNPKFAGKRELVIRLGDYASRRTFAVKADKASKDLNRQLVNALKSGQKGLVTISKV